MFLVDEHQGAETPYERLLGDAMAGNGALFIRQDAVEAAWAAVHGDKVHTYVGKTAFRLAFAARWLPGRLRKQMRRPRSLSSALNE